jgi:hypothetical protein
MTPSPSDVICQYLKIRNYIDAQQKAFDTSMEPYRNALEQLENYMATLALEEVGPSGKWSHATPAGTAYRKLYTSTKVADRDTWFDFVFDGRRDGFLTTHVAKDAVTEYIDQNGATPPGLDISSGYKIIFNSPKGI